MGCLLYASYIVLCALTSLLSHLMQLLSPYASDDEGFDTLAIGIGMHASLGEKRVLEAVSIIDEGLADLKAKPHWGKLINMTRGRAEELYGEKYRKFVSYVESVDPNRKFSNKWLDDIFQ